MAGQAQTLFRGEKLRGLLQNVWGWATVGAIARDVGIASFLGAIAVLIGLALGFVGHERACKANEADAIMVTDSKTSVPMPVG